MKTGDEVEVDWVRLGHWKDGDPPLRINGKEPDLPIFGVKLEWDAKTRTSVLTLDMYVGLQDTPPNGNRQTIKGYIVDEERWQNYQEWARENEEWDR